ncbi:general amino acid permease agp2 [Paramarasmius palmivorus]|uniref:General amino acid permease agp2 n=1 Tax=Paramarasmius palmivorus TaxID=297713 RepID=A0AAW0DTW2_9AGAR
MSVAIASLGIKQHLRRYCNGSFNLVTASQVLNWAVMAFTYIRFYYALKAQGISRDTLPYKGFWQPFCGYYALTGSLIVVLIGGYTVFLDGNWDVPNFLFSYTMVGVVPALFVGWKVYHRTQWRKLEEIDFFERERAIVDRYEEQYVEEVPRTRLGRFWSFIFPS